jgi:hypothetical protein
MDVSGWPHALVTLPPEETSLMVCNEQGLIWYFIFRVHHWCYEENIATFLIFTGATRAAFAISYAPACVRKHFKAGVLKFILEIILRVMNRWSISNYTYLYNYLLT